LKENIKILITGGSGFIGTNLVEHYVTKGYRVLSLDKAPPKIQNHLSIWKQVDILDLESLSANIQAFQPSHIIHLAARTDLDEKKNIEGYKTNTLGVENLLTASKGCSDLKRVMFTSSMYVCQPGYQPTHYDDYLPHTVYGQSKVLSEKIVKEKSLLPFEWLIIRPTSIWGPWFGHPYKDFFYHVKKKTFVLMSGKTATKTYGFIYNSIVQIDHLLFTDSATVNQKTFYIGDHPALNVNEWAEEVSQQLNIHLFQVPKIIIRFGAWFGDFLGLCGIKFPLQSFRLKNLTTDNEINLLYDTLKVTPKVPYSTKDGVSITLKWLQKYDKNF